MGPTRDNRVITTLATKKIVSEFASLEDDFGISVRGSKNDDGDRAKKAIDVGGIDAARSLFWPVHCLRVSSDGGTGLAGTPPGAVAGGDGGRWRMRPTAHKQPPGGKGPPPSGRE